MNTTQIAEAGRAILAEAQQAREDKRERGYPDEQLGMAALLERDLPLTRLAQLREALTAADATYRPGLEALGREVSDPVLAHHPAADTIHRIRHKVAEGLMALTAWPRTLERLEAERAGFDLKAFRGGRASVVRDYVQCLDGTERVAREALASATEMLAKIAPSLTVESRRAAEMAHARSERIVPPRRPSGVRPAVSAEE